MHLSEILVRELDAFRGRHDLESLDILETGTIRNAGENYHVNDGWSTLTFAGYVRDHGGSFRAIDLDTSAAHEVLQRNSVRQYATLIEGHSIDILAGVTHRAGVMSDLGSVYVDVAFLDSDNNADLILHEYLIVRQIMRSPGLIMVDDVDIASTGVVKGHALIPWLAAHGTAYCLEKRHGDGYETGVLVIEV